MNLPEDSKSRMLLIELIGLSITGLLLFVIACLLQLALRVLSGGALEARLGVLAFGFLFYVCAAFVAAGTRQRPDHAQSLVANVSLRVGFLSLAFLLWRPTMPGSWLALAMGLVLVVHGGSYGFALLRRRALNALLRGPAHVQDTFIERFLRVPAPTYHAIPIGGALGTLFGGLVTRDPDALLRHAWAGVFAARALAELVPLCRGALTLASSLTLRHAEAQIALRAVGSAKRKELRVFAPADRSGPLTAQVRQAAHALRRILVVNQLQRASAVGVAGLLIWRLELQHVPITLPALALLTGLFALVLAPYAIGQRQR